MHAKFLVLPSHAIATMHTLKWRRACLWAVLGMLAYGCQSVEPRGYSVLGANDDYAVVHVSGPTSLGALAQDFLGSEHRGWVIGDRNGITELEPGDTVVIPLQSRNAVGIQSGAYQTVPILSYHRFGPNNGRLSVTGEQFRLQLEYLKTNGFTVIPLSLVYDFLQGNQALPKRSVVITIDDGYRSTYEIAFPILKEYGFPATVFVYTDWIGKGGLTWTQMAKMKASGLIDIQAHSKSHSNLTVRLENETLQEYRARVSTEVQQPKTRLEKNLDGPIENFSYPYGATNALLVDELRRGDYRLGLTVKRGGNAFFYHPYTLRRTMIYRDDGLERFAQALQTSIPLPNK